METKNFEKLLIKTAFCCMASDGNIDKREIETIEDLCKNSDLFTDINLHSEINILVNEINSNGKKFIQEYLNLLDYENFSKTEELYILDFALKIIHADEFVEYSEIKFFKNIRHRLNISNEDILFAHPGIDDFLEEDIKTNLFLEIITKNLLDSIELPQFDVIGFGNNVT